MSLKQDGPTQYDWYFTIPEDQMDKQVVNIMIYCHHILFNQALYLLKVTNAAGEYLRRCFKVLIKKVILSV